MKYLFIFVIAGMLFGCSNTTAPDDGTRVYDGRLKDLPAYQTPLLLFTDTMSVDQSKCNSVKFYTRKSATDSMIETTGDVWTGKRKDGSPFTMFSVPVVYGVPIQFFYRVVFSGCSS